METVLYTVEPGDTLWGICKLRDLYIDHVAQLNGLDQQAQHYLEVGQQLKLPLGEGTQPDTELSLHILGLDWQPLKNPELKLEYDGHTHILKGNEQGWINTLFIYDCSKGLKVWFKQITGQFVLIAQHQTVPMGKKVYQLSIRAMKVKGQLKPLPGATWQTRSALQQEVRKKNPPVPEPKPVSGCPFVGQTDAVPTQTSVKETRTEGGHPTHAVAPVRTEGDLFLPPGNEKYRKFLLAAAAKYNCSAPALAAFANAEASQVRDKNGNMSWNEESGSREHAYGLMQFMRPSWIAVSHLDDTLVAQKKQASRVHISEPTLLSWRANGELSIDAAAAYGVSNLKALKNIRVPKPGASSRKDGKIDDHTYINLPIDSLSETEKIKLMYLAHHEGTQGAAMLIMDWAEINEARLTAQVGKSKHYQSLMQLFPNNNFKAAYRYWMFVQQIDGKLSPEHFMLNPPETKCRSMEEIVVALGGPALVKPAAKAHASSAQASSGKASTASTSGKAGGANAPAWHDPLMNCTIRTQKLLSLQSALFAGWRQHYYHQGLDIEATPGTPIYAVANCKITSVYTGGKGDYGKNIILTVDINDLPAAQKAYLQSSHPQLKEVSFFYAHLSEIDVKTNDYCQAGQVLGKTGHTGNAHKMTTVNLGSHMHFEARNTGGGIGKGLQHRFDALPFIQNSPNRPPKYEPRHAKGSA